MQHNHVDLNEKEIITNLLLDKLALERKLEIARGEVKDLKGLLESSVPEESIALMVKKYFEKGNIPLPEALDKKLPVTIQCEKRDVSFSGGKISVKVKFYYGDGYCHEIDFYSIFIPEHSARKEEYPYFHFGYTKEDLLKLADR